MTTVLWVIALAAILIGFVGVVVPLLPGTPLLFAGMLLAAWIDDFQRIGPTWLAFLGFLAIAAWAMDYVAAVWGVKRSGASSLAMLGAGIGAIAGMLGGVVGVLLGPIVGAIGGELIARRDHRTAARAGVAAGVAFIVASVAKLALAVAMVGIFALAYFS